MIMVTTDKVYQTISCKNGFTEDDRLGGNDPYSSSKAALEIATKSWRKSFFGKNIVISTARAGNVIGGGDWAKDRIVPDTINSILKDIPLKLRYPNAIRPWQHVLDPLWGYITLAEKQITNKISCEFNFGPKMLDSSTVHELVNLIAFFKGKEPKIEILENQPLETAYLNLSIDKAFKELNWAPKWDFRKTVLKQ